MEEYRLVYWNLRGRAEPIRMIFHAAKVDFVDDRIERKDWPKFKSSMPWNQVPVLYIGDKVLAQSTSICRYLAHEFKLAGIDLFESAKCDEYVDATNDLVPAMKKIAHEKDEDVKSKLNDELIISTLPNFLEKFEKILNDKNGLFLVGNNLTWCDIFVSNTLERLENVYAGPKILDDYPRLKGMKKAVYEHPGIKEWVSIRPQD